MGAYKRMLDTSKELHEFLSSGKKIRDGNTLRTQKELEMKEQRENRPPWRSTGAGQAMPHWDRPSKYQRDANVRAKINTGLGPGTS
jgi:hypothetical protein